MLILIKSYYTRTRQTNYIPIEVKFDYIKLLLQLLTLFWKYVYYNAKKNAAKIYKTILLKIYSSKRIFFYVWFWFPAYTSSFMPSFVIHCKILLRGASLLKLEEWYFFLSDENFVEWKCKYICMYVCICVWIIFETNAITILKVYNILFENKFKI